jgi:L-fuculose-phosphate aldolase
MTLGEHAEAIAAACRRMHARGLIAGNEGNVSVRLRTGELLITPAGVDKATITGARIVRVQAAGTLRHEGQDRRRGDTSAESLDRPSTEMAMHRACYAMRPDVGAVVHAHPPAATGFATAGVLLPADVLPELPVVVGAVALVPYARAGTPDLAAALASFLPTNNAFLLANHGVTTIGATLDEALLRMETVEQAARIILAARLLGGEHHLSVTEMQGFASSRKREPSSPGSAPAATN